MKKLTLLFAILAMGCEKDNCEDIVWARRTDANCQITPCPHPETGKIAINYLLISEFNKIDDGYWNITHRATTCDNYGYQEFWEEYH